MFNDDDATDRIGEFNFPRSVLLKKRKDNNADDGETDKTGEK